MSKVEQDEPGGADGWFLFVKPLPVGEHKIHVAGAIDCARS